MRCKASVETIRDTLIGRYQAERVFKLTQAPALYDFYQTQFAQCDERIEVAVDTRRLVSNLPRPPYQRRDIGPNSRMASPFEVRAALYGILGVDLNQIHGLET